MICPYIALIQPVANAKIASCLLEMLNIYHCHLLSMDFKDIEATACGNGGTSLDLDVDLIWHSNSICSSVCGHCKLIYLTLK